MRPNNAIQTVIARNWKGGGSTGGRAVAAQLDVLTDQQLLPLARYVSEYVCVVVCTTHCVVSTAGP